MKLAILKTTCAMAIGCLLAVDAQAITLDGANNSTADMFFTGTGNTFVFRDATAGPGIGFDFVITTSSGVGDSVGSYGHLGGVFTIGAITINGGLQTAPVTSVGGVIDIFGPGGFTLSADIAWIDIFTLGTGGGLNAGGTINMTNITYAGASSDLLALSIDSSGVGTLSFTFVPAETLTSLTADGTTHTTAYSISVNNVAGVPEGGSALAMLGLALIGVEGLRRKLKRA